MTWGSFHFFSVGGIRSHSHASLTLPLLNLYLSLPDTYQTMEKLVSRTIRIPAQVAKNAVPDIGGKVMGPKSGWNLQQYLESFEYPANREDLISAARSRNAPTRLHPGA